MQYTPAASHSHATIAWLHDQYIRAYRRPVIAGAVRDECMRHLQRLSGEKSLCLDVDQPRLLTPARSSAWLREHVASEPASLLKGVVL